MKEVFELKATKVNGEVTIEANGICSKRLLYTVVASILENIEKGEKVHEN